MASAEVIVGPYEFVNNNKRPARITLAVSMDNVIEQRFYHDNGVKAEKSKCGTFEEALAMVESLIETYKQDKYMDPKDKEAEDKKKKMQTSQ